MAMLVFEGNMAEGDGYRKFAGPRAARGVVDTLLSTLWMMLPPGERSVMALEARARLGFGEAIDEWRAMTPDERAQAVAGSGEAGVAGVAGGEADVVVPDVAAPAAPSTAETEALFGDDAAAAVARMFGPDHVKRCGHQALMFAGLLLPPARRTDAEVERVVRHLFDSALAQWWDDARTFDFPTT